MIVVMPLKPEFSGDWGSRDLDAVSYWNYATICRGENSLYGRLKDKFKGNYMYIIAMKIHTFSAIILYMYYNLFNAALNTQEVFFTGAIAMVDQYGTSVYTVKSG